MYEDVQPKVQADSNYSSKFNINVGVHQGSVLSPLLFGIVMEATSMKYGIGCPWELLYTDDLAIAADFLKSLRILFQC